jgi:CRP-like cAMP-binding protein
MITSTNDCFFGSDNALNHFFSELSDSHRKILYTDSIVRKIKKGGIIFKEGDEPAGLIFLKSGSAKVFKVGAGNREQIVRLSHQSSFVGYKALFAEKKHTTYSIAIEDSELIVFQKKSLFKLAEINHLFTRVIIKALANEISFSFNRMINLTQKHIRGRIAESLLLLKEIYGFKDDNKTLNVHFTRENIAYLSNMTTSNAIRTIKTFEKENLVATEGKCIQLINIDSLLHISKNG